MLILQRIFDHDALNLSIFTYSYTIKKITRLKINETAYFF